MSYRVISIKIIDGNMIYSGESIDSFIIDIKKDSIKTDIDFNNKLSDFVYIEIMDSSSNEILFLKNNFDKSSNKKLGRKFGFVLSTLKYGGY